MGGSEPPLRDCLVIQYCVPFCLFVCFCCYSSQGFSVALEPVIELALVDQAGLELTEICCLCLPNAGIKGVRHHYLPVFLSLPPLRL